MSNKNNALTLFMETNYANILTQYFSAKGLKMQWTCLSSHEELLLKFNDDTSDTAFLIGNIFMSKEWALKWLSLKYSPKQKAAHHVSADRLRDHTADGGFGAGGSRSSRGWGGHPGEGRAGRGQEGQRHRGRGDVHGGRGGGWGGWRRLGSVQRRRRLSLGGWDHFADDTVNKRETEKSKHTV